MALSKEGLETAIQSVIDGPPDSVESYVSGICDAIDSYLSNIELDPFPAPGVNPAGPTPDPSFVEDQPVEPAAPLKAIQFRAAFLAAANAAAGGADRDYSACTAGFVTDISLLASVKNAGGYTSAGSTACPSGPDVDAAMDQGLTDIAPPEGKFAKELSKQIHDATTSSTFSGPYLKAAFAGPSPYSSSLS
jgi:hypothetical protein